MPTFIATIANMDQLFGQIACCCLQTYTVNDVLLVMYCMCLPAFFVPSADKSQLWVYIACGYLLLFRHM